MYTYTIYTIDNQFRKAAHRRQKLPSLPFNPENLYDMPITHAQHMLSRSWTGILGADEPNSDNNESNTPSITPSSARPDSIYPGSSQAYAESILPPSNQAQGLQMRKRHRSQVSGDAASVTNVAARVNALEQRVLKAREEKERMLLQREAELQKELNELESI